MDEIGPIALFVLWALASLFGRAAQGKKQQRQRRRATTTLPERSDREMSRPGQPTTFDELLAEMRGQLEQGQQAKRDAEPATWQHKLPDDEDVEDTTSLEVEPEVVSLEVEPYHVERVQVDQAAATEALVQRRIAAAELRNREWRLEDHRRFDQAIREGRQAPVRRVSPATRSLRQAMIWNEVLQPPVSLRETPPART